MRVVFDTNIFISMLIWRNKELESLYALFRKNQITVSINLQIIQEITRVLNYPKFAIPLLKINLTAEKIIKAIINDCLIFSSSEKPLKIIKDDPSDNIILDCALNSEADFIISGDKHLLKLKSFQNIPVLTPRQFLNRFKK
ncbi:putative toxin-antitoxin system toxin component, PIN family [Patescibacteria group bacterium]|nr:putative toxin-antitoxin system toxin component, PIN family [Patescibacteria group bacterium]MBU4000268.1 putative toxin-antitoxin system toxin component, PIN family [Patescibacteria group bacterium]MBU4056321.1 putative toxin-antitoxin system toxin component, PIN family [Patescibacteria group bacterium]MBU4368276.1 putative toxin-antitoxin system toxin component, PIN family [Patescibacteria group bacterium]